MITVPTGPIAPCSFTGPVPGVGADVVDPDGKPLAPGNIGDLVMRRPSIGLTRGLWNDRQRYLATYWDVIPDMWVHGDFASIEADGTWLIHGRSDDTLKIAGKRTGPSEIETLMMESGEITEQRPSACPIRSKDRRLSAFVFHAIPPPQASLKQRLIGLIVDGLGPPFRPAEIIFVTQLPKTRNMKIMRRVVRGACLDEDPGDLSALVNPEAVDELRQRFAMLSQPEP